MGQKMQAIEIIDGGGGPEVLRITERPVPVILENEILIKVGASGVNRPDILQRQGLYPPPAGASDIPGLEVAGEVVSVGKMAQSFSVGDKVMALVTGGGYAEYCAAPEPQCLKIPEPLSIEEAAAFPETYFTVWNNVFDRCKLEEGEVLLVHGGSSGIGTTAIQLGTALGATVFATAGSEEKCRECEKLGAVYAINYTCENFVDVIKGMTKNGANVILDMVGADYVQRNIKVAAPDGRICNIAFLSGSNVQVDLMLVMLKRLTLTGSTLRAMPVSFKAAIAKSLERKIFPLINEGKVKPVIYDTFSLNQAADAHVTMESNKHIGKLVLTI